MPQPADWEQACLQQLGGRRLTKRERRIMSNEWHAPDDHLEPPYPNSHSVKPVNVYESLATAKSRNIDPQCQDMLSRHSDKTSQTSASQAASNADEENSLLDLKSISLEDSTHVAKDDCVENHDSNNVSGGVVLQERQVGLSAEETLSSSETYAGSCVSDHSSGSLERHYQGQGNVTPYSTWKQPLDEEAGTLRGSPYLEAWLSPRSSEASSPFESRPASFCEGAPPSALRQLLTIHEADEQDESEPANMPVEQMHKSGSNGRRNGFPSPDRAEEKAEGGWAAILPLRPKMADAEKNLCSETDLQDLRNSNGAQSMGELFRLGWLPQARASNYDSTNDDQQDVKGNVNSDRAQREQSQRGEQTGDVAVSGRVVLGSSIGGQEQQRAQNQGSRATEDTEQECGGGSKREEAELEGRRLEGREGMGCGAQGQGDDQGSETERRQRELFWAWSKRQEAQRRATSRALEQVQRTLLRMLQEERAY